MGIAWEAYHKGVPLLGVPENPTDFINLFYVGGWASIRAALPNALSPVRALVFFIQLATGTSCDA